MTLGPPRLGGAWGHSWRLRGPGVGHFAPPSPHGLWRRVGGGGCATPVPSKRGRPPAPGRAPGHLPRPAGGRLAAERRPRGGGGRRSGARGGGEAGCGAAGAAPRPHVAAGGGAERGRPGRHEEAPRMSSQRRPGKAQLRRSLSEQLRDSTAKAWDLLWRNVRERRLAGRSRRAADPCRTGLGEPGPGKGGACPGVTGSRLGVVPGSGLGHGNPGGRLPRRGSGSPACAVGFLRHRQVQVGSSGGWRAGRALSPPGETVCFVTGAVTALGHLSAPEARAPVPRWKAEGQSRCSGRSRHS